VNMGKSVHIRMMRTIEDNLLCTHMCAINTWDKRMDEHRWMMMSRMYACTHVGMYACMHVRMYTCTHVCMYACTQVLRGETRHSSDDYGQQLSLRMLGEYTYGDMCHIDRNNGCPSSYVCTTWEFKLANVIMDMKLTGLSEFNRERIERSTWFKPIIPYE